MYYQRIRWHGTQYVQLEHALSGPLVFKRRLRPEDRPLAKDTALLPRYSKFNGF